MADANTINEHINAAIAHVMSPPAVVRPYWDSNGDFSTLIKRLTERDAQSAAEFQTWLDNIASARDKLSAFLEDSSSQIDSEAISRLRRLASKIEDKADNNAKNYSQTMKRMRRLIREMDAVIGKASADPMRALFKKGEVRWNKEIEELLSTALFFRGLAGRYDPDRETVYSARSADDLRNFFDAKLAN